MNGLQFAGLCVIVVGLIIGSLLAGRLLWTHSQASNIRGVDAAIEAGVSVAAGAESALAVLTPEQRAELALQEWLHRNEAAVLRREIADDRALMDEFGWPTAEEFEQMRAAEEQREAQARAEWLMTTAIDILADGDTHAKAMLIEQSCEWPADWVERLEVALNEGLLV